MDSRRKRLCRDLLGLARNSFLTDRAASVTLQLLATAVELGTTDSLAEAAITHATARLDEFRADVDSTLAEIASLKLPSLN